MKYILAALCLTVTHGANSLFPSSVTPNHQAQFKDKMQSLAPSLAPKVQQIAADYDYKSNPIEETDLGSLLLLDFTIE